MLYLYKNYLLTIVAIISFAYKAHSFNQDKTQELRNYLAAISNKHPAQDEFSEKIYSLVMDGADPEIIIGKGGDARMLIHFAAQFGDESLIKFLKKHSENTKNKKRTKRFKITAWFKSKKQGASIRTYINAPSGNEYTPLMWAALYGNTEAVITLIKLGAEKEASLFLSTPLTLAAAKGNWNVVRELIYYGCDIEALDENGNTALVYAVKQGKLDEIDYLLDHGADIDLGDKKERTPLILAIKKGNEKAFLKLIMRGAEIDMKDSKGRTALMIAARYNRLEMAIILLEHDAYIDDTDNYKETALFHAAYKGNKRIFKYLVRQGANDKLENLQGNIAYEAYKTLL